MFVRRYAKEEEEEEGINLYKRRIN